MARLWLAFLFNAKWAVAILVAAAFGKAKWRSAFFALLGILRDHRKRVSKEKYCRRIRACNACPVFYAPLETCGTPLTREHRGTGCYCYQPVAASFAAKRCWLDDELGREAAPYGWRANHCR